MRADQNLTAFVDLKSVIVRCSDLVEELARFFPSFTPAKRSAITESALLFIRSAG